ncbi:ABC transporter permease [Micromonospora echinospora]
MTAPTINGTRYPQPVEDLLPAARALTLPEGQKLPSRNRLMREFHIGAPKADALRSLLMREGIHRDLDDAKRAGRLVPLGIHPAANEPAPIVFDYAEPIGPDPASTPAVPESAPLAAPDLTPAPEAPPAEQSGQVETVGHPGTKIASRPARRAVVWPVILLALPAFVAIWGGWVGLGKLTGFGKVNLLPGIGDGWVIDTAITLPIGVETYGAYALYVWLSGRVPVRAARFAKWSALGSLGIGALGQVAYHLLIAANITAAPWWITTLVACLPVAVLGMGAALAHLMHADH